MHKMALMLPHGPDNESESESDSGDWDDSESNSPGSSTEDEAERLRELAEEIFRDSDE